MLKTIAALALGITLYSCGKCKKLDCQNDAGCSVLNGKATCTCKDFYEGERCDSEVRAAYYGQYTGKTTVTVSGVKFEGTIQFSLESYKGADNFKMVSTSSNGSTTTWYCRLTSNNDFTISGISDNDIRSIEGSGTLSGSNLKASGNYTVVENGVSIKALYTINANK